MKKLICLFVFSFIFTGCSTQRLDSEGHTYSEDITFRIIRVMSKKISEADMSRTTYISKGGRFKVFTMEFKNNSSEEKTIDFEEFQLMDKNKKVYNIKLVMDGFNSSFDDFDNMKKTIKAGKKKTFYAEFWPSFPKDQEVHLLLRGTEIKLQ